MHATIQKPIDEILGYLKSDERVFVVGCDNCAAKCHSGGIPETEEMAKRLKAKGYQCYRLGLYCQWYEPVQARISEKDVK